LQLAIVRILSEFPYLRSPIQVIDKALEAAELDGKEVFADLGCGDGAVLLRAAERFRVFSVGFEINPMGLQELIEIVHSDLFSADLSRFDVIYIYPSPLVTERLTNKILAECAKGTKILVHDYPLRLLQPINVVKLPGGPLHTHTLYLYKI